MHHTTHAVAHGDAFARLVAKERQEVARSMTPKGRRAIRRIVRNLSIAQAEAAALCRALDIDGVGTDDGSPPRAEDLARSLCGVAPRILPVDFLGEDLGAGPRVVARREARGEYDFARPRNA